MSASTRKTPRTRPSPRRRRALRTAGAAVVAAAAAALAPRAGLAGEPGAAAPARASDPLVVHEWGTFTCVQGSDGVALEGLSREEEHLPGFVYDRAQIRDCPLREKGWKGLETPATGVTQKMETPVVYFHSASERRVRLRVDFVKGLLTQWYPVSDLLGPPEGALGSRPIDVATIDRSFLEWDVTVLPKSADPAAPAPVPGEVPSVAADDPWQFAREVDASWLRTAPRKAPEREGPVEAERYLFYRGLGAFPTALRATMPDDDSIRVRNEGAHVLTGAVAFEIRGDRGRIALVDPVPARAAEETTDASVRVALPPSDHWGSAADVAEKLGSIVHGRLVGLGLRSDEARAMVRTWSRSWFRSEGVRILWFVPRPQVDAILPMSIDPAPDELVRVLVGRTELIPPRTAEEDRLAVIDTAADDPERARRGMDVLARRDRFLEPHLRNVVAEADRRAQRGAPLPGDDVARSRASGWLKKLAMERASVPARETPFVR